MLEWLHYLGLNSLYLYHLGHKALKKKKNEGAKTFKSSVVEFYPDKALQ